MPIRKISEYNNNDINFYHVEKAGYVTVSEMIYDAFTDMINNGFNPVVTIVQNDFVTPKRRIATTWPPQIQKFTIADPGSGYRTGQNVTIIASNVVTPLVARLTVSDSGALKGRVTSFTVANPPEYSSTPSQPADAAYWDASLEAIQTDFFSGNFLTRQSVTASSGVAPVGYRNTTITQPSGNNQYPLWAANYGYEGSGIWNGSPTASNTWPTNSNVLWSWDKDETNVFVGQEIWSDEPTASIPPGTYITSQGADKITANITYYPATGGLTPSPATWFETRLDFKWWILSNLVTIPAETIVKTRGRGLKFFSNTEPATVYSVTLEAGGGVDPLNDSVGVRGNVAATTTNNNIVEINNINSGNAWKPVIYPGQEVTSELTVGSLNVNETVTVISANMSVNNTAAVVTLSSNVSFSIANEPVRFKFKELQPWRIAANVMDKQTVTIYAATPVQLEDNGNISYVTDSAGVIVDRAGAMGAAPTKKGEPDLKVTYQGFISRNARVKDYPQAYPLSYGLTITDRGIFFGSWEGSWSTLQKTAVESTDGYFNWFLIQRPVNKITGRVLTTGAAPVFCINSVGYKYYKFIVRESDILHPYQGVDDDAYRLRVNESATTPTIVQDKEGMAYRTPADAHWRDSFAVLNTTNQIALTEDSKYLVSFLHNLTTPRFRYSEELDMIGQTSADVCMASNDISITAYQESGPRLYKALASNGVYNSGLRIAVLKKMP